MDIDQIRQELASHSGTRLLEAHGDTFAVYDPRGDLPPERQMPWATIVTSDTYDAASNLDRPGVFRLNIGLPRTRFRELVNPAEEYDATAVDALFPHPVYARQNWVGVLNPQQSWPFVRELLDEAYTFAVRKYDNTEQRRTQV
ncbi:DUF6194 family protein [Saccharomonospora sp. NPDC046836]|uniref:DUF6194 family protein n=1 Tax=Saccharomonospora sp. NPDC046836 TaxID=3156921 RepID=UPI00340401FA